MLFLVSSSLEEEIYTLKIFAIEHVFIDIGAVNTITRRHEEQSGE